MLIKSFDLLNMQVAIYVLRLNVLVCCYVGLFFGAKSIKISLARDRQRDNVKDSMRWYTPTMDTNRKTNVYLHCMLSRSILFLFWQILLHLIPLLNWLSFQEKTSKHRFSLLLLWKYVSYMKPNQTDALPPLLWLEFIVLFLFWCDSNFPSLDSLI